MPDGIGIVWAGKVFGKSFNGRIHGVDLLDEICRKVSEKPITVGFLGGRENVAQDVAERLAKKYPGLKVAFALMEWQADRTLRSRSQFENFSDGKHPSVPMNISGLGARSADSNEKFSHENAPRAKYFNICFYSAVFKSTSRN